MWQGTNSELFSLDVLEDVRRYCIKKDNHCRVLIIGEHVLFPYRVANGVGSC